MSRWRQNYWHYPAYTPVSSLKYDAEREIQARIKRGESVEPVRIDGKAIASTFWGKAWCRNLESYSDYENRLPRGRTYVRGGMVIDLKVLPGNVTALVRGTSLYSINIKIEKVPEKQWEAIRRECSGKIDSLVALLSGKLSSSVMDVVTRKGTGLFPAPREIQMTCSCPDWAGLCKHLAAVLYGIGARLDKKPELLFLLRNVDHNDLITEPGMVAGVEVRGQETGISHDELSGLFGIEIHDEAKPSPAVAPARPLPAPAAPAPAVPAPAAPAPAAPAPAPVKPAASPKGPAPVAAPARPKSPTVVPSAPPKTAPAVSSVQPAAAKAPKPKAKPIVPATITLKELRAVGLGYSTVRTWIREGALLGTTKPGVYVRTPQTAGRLEAFQKRKRKPAKPA